MKSFSRLFLAATALLGMASVPSAYAIEVRPAYSSPKNVFDRWTPNNTRAAYGHQPGNSQNAQPGVYVGAELGYMIADGIADYPTRFGNGGVFLGYRYNRFFAMELGYNHTTEADRQRDIVGFESDSNATLQQVSVDFLGTLPVTPKATLLGGVGYGLITEEYENTVAGITTQKTTEDGSVIRLSAGGEYALTPDVSLRALLRYGIPGDAVNDRVDNLWNTTVGIKYQW
jgi:hypothetical protein